MSPPVVVDLTYVAARLGAPTPTGIERVDAAYAAHFTTRPQAGPHPGSGDALAVHYGLRDPHALRPATARALVAASRRPWQPEGGAAADPVFRAVVDWLAASPARLAPVRPPRAERGWERYAAGWERWRWRLRHDRGAAVPAGAIYLNVAQYAFEYPAFFRWLERRRDVRAVFFIHDLLPLDEPAFFREGYEALFERRVRTMARFAHAAIVSSAAVGERVAAEMRRRGRDPFPILCAPLPPPAQRAGASEPLGLEVPMPPTPYFVMVGTVEPRKNHLLLLHLWRRLAARGGAVPRLVLVGPRGWENEQVVDLLDRDRLLAPYVAEVSGLSTPALHRLIGGARALLMPSFAEGYGLPVAEALAAGTPVLAADIPVFREVSQSCARLLDPLDGPSWLAAIEAYTSATPAWEAARRAATTYRAPRWESHFAAVEAFLATLGQKSDASPLTSQSP